ncbi:alpha/beta hydrolase [Thalassospiraceae bacterium LMO-JJ14]|nr:alpha/beta hydrolase [Thalassospiraceae bacterium LMO-JJ14]
MPEGEVYRRLDKVSLDAAYNNSAAVKDSADRVEDWERIGKTVRAKPNARLDLAYGPLPRNKIDYFQAAPQNAPLLVFIHGGYWQRNSKETFSYVADGLVPLGINVAVIGYTLAPEASLTQIVGETMQALDFLYDAANDLGFDPTGIFVSGWSAGGHLAAAAAAHPHVAGVLSVSGVFDLEPIEKTYINDILNLSQSEIVPLSPIHNIPARRIPYLLYVGGDELSELQRQSAAYADALQQAGLTAELSVPPGYNHFTLVEEMGRPDGLLVQGVRRLIELAE